MHIPTLQEGGRVVCSHSMNVKLTGEISNTVITSVLIPAKGGRRKGLSIARLTPHLLVHPHFACVWLNLKMKLKCSHSSNTDHTFCPLTLPNNYRKQNNLQLAMEKCCMITRTTQQTPKHDTGSLNINPKILKS